MAMGRGQQPAAAIADVSFPMDLVVGARDFSLACGGAHNPQSER